MDNKSSIFVWSEFERQCGERDNQCDSNTPIKSGEMLLPCVRGCDQLKEDDELKELLRKVYRGES